MSGLRDIFTAGQCNADGSQMGQSNNPFKAFLNQLVMEPGKHRQNMPGFVQMDPSQAQMGDVMKMMDQTWATSQQAAYEQMMRENVMMEHAFIESKLMEQEMAHKHALMDHQWRHDMERGIAEGWQQDFIENEVLDSREKQFNSAFDQAKEELDAKEAFAKQTTGGIINIMMSDPDPKFRNSKFLDFLKRVNTGELEVKEDNSLVHHPEKAVVDVSNDKDLLMREAFNQASKESEIISEKETLLDGTFARAQQMEEMDEKTLGNMETAWSEATKEMEDEVLKQKEDRQKKLEGLWNRMINEYDENNPALMEKLNNEWLSMMEDWNNDMFSDHWQKASDIEETQYSNMKSEYRFNEANKYANANAPHRLFIDLIREGNTHEAMQALESHLQKNPMDHAGWLMLGNLYQENDQDQKSVTAMLQALKVTPDCLHSLLQIGVGCTNIMDETHSMMYLHRWLRLNPKYSKFGGHELITEGRLTLDDFASEEILAINHILLERFEDAKNHGGLNDPEFCMAYGVVAFIGRQYKLAVDMMNRVVELDPQNYSAWNKLGACFAQVNESELGRMSYRKALDLKPNYVRPWVNLGMTYSSKKDYENAISYHLNALSLNPDLIHVWTYVESNLACKQEFNQIPLIKQQNPRVFGDRFEVLDYKDLPAPEGQDYVKMLEDYSLKSGVEQWAAKFDANNN